MSDIHLDHYFSQRQIELDPAQQTLTANLERLLNDALKRPRRFSFLKRRSPRGAYVRGLPGRGKTMIMDAIFAACGTQAKRIHYHQFLRDLHLNLNRSEHRNSEFLVPLAEKVARQCRVFCLDEFHLHDAGDARLMERFLQVLFDERVFVVLTSNYEPEKLLPDPFQHHHALGTIAVIRRHMDELLLEGPQDYRYRHESGQRHYVSPNGDSADQLLREILKNRGIASAKADVLLKLSDRSITALSCSDTHVWFRFADLCGGARSHLDYLEMTERWPIIVVTGVEAEALQQPSILRRFIWLVDVLYDRRKTLLLSSDLPIETMLSDPALQEDALRTLSRLTEMQTSDFSEATTLSTGLLE